MARHSKKSVGTEKSGEEALAIARGTKKPGQTKEQTRLIAQGIQKGIALYKKQHASKKRELDKTIKKAAMFSSAKTSPVDDVAKGVPCTSNKLPWGLLLLSWLCFGIYFFMTI